MNSSCYSEVVHTSGLLLGASFGHAATLHSTTQQKQARIVRLRARLQHRQERLTQLEHARAVFAVSRADMHHDSVLSPTSVALTSLSFEEGGDGSVAEAYGTSQQQVTQLLNDAMRAEELECRAVLEAEEVVGRRLITQQFIICVHSLASHRHSERVLALISHSRQEGDARRLAQLQTQCASAQTALVRARVKHNNIMNDMRSILDEWTRKESELRETGILASPKAMEKSTPEQVVLWDDSMPLEVIDALERAAALARQVLPPGTTRGCSVESPTHPVVSVSMWQKLLHILLEQPPLWRQASAAVQQHINALRSSLHAMDVVVAADHRDGSVPVSDDGGDGDLSAIVARVRRQTFP